MKSTIDFELSIKFDTFKSLINPLTSRSIVCKLALEKTMKEETNFFSLFSFSQFSITNYKAYL